MEFSVNLKEALEIASSLATKTGGIVCTEHLLYGITALRNSKGSKFLRPYGITAEYLIKHFFSRPVRSSVEMSSRGKRAIMLTAEPRAAERLRLFFPADFSLC